jgi:hypothetical protein
MKTTWCAAADKASILSVTVKIQQWVSLECALRLSSILMHHYTFFHVRKNLVLFSTHVFILVFVLVFGKTAQVWNFETWNCKSSCVAVIISANTANVGECLMPDRLEYFAGYIWCSYKLHEWFFQTANCCLIFYEVFSGEQPCQYVTMFRRFEDQLRHHLQGAR